MTIDFVTLLHQSDSLLLFVVLAFGLLLGKVRIGNFQIGNTIGVLFTALLFGQMGFQFSTSTENVGFMLFIFCVGIEAGPHFFSVFLRDGIHYITLTLVILLSALLLTVGLAKFFNLGPAWPPAFWQVPHLHAGPGGGPGRPAKRIAQPAPPDRHAVGARQHGDRLRPDLLGGPGGPDAGGALPSFPG
jgi:hypothetical protein